MRSKTDTEKQTRLIVQLAEENRLLRMREKRHRRIIQEAVFFANTEGELVTPVMLRRWRKAVEL